MAALLALALFAAALPPGSTYSADPAASAIRFQVVHKLHRVHGRATSLEGRAVSRPDGTVAAMVRVPLATLQTGDANRDQHMVETLEVNKYPFVVFKGVARLGPGGELPPGPLTLEGQLDLHGVQRPVSLPLQVEPAAGGGLRARGGFEVSLDAYRIERPSLLFVKIEDACRIDFDLLLREDRR
ncbi:MAG TPA: YceI family protein [Anaeromyxobacteraceae bacterium]|nr:YceI family protein [Anaeromyxobacteraceae bacterium]